MPVKQQSIIAEVVGPAGAGKSTLMRELSRRDPRIDAVFSLRRRHYVPAFSRRVVEGLPTAVLRLASGRPLSWKEFRMRVHLRAVHDTVARRAWSDHPVTLFDQGPVYMLAGLRDFALQRPAQRAFEHWWQARLQEWSHALDLIVLLDASPETLWQRIRDRDKQHHLKNSTEAHARACVEQYTFLYDDVVTRLSEFGGVRVLRVNTQHTSLEQTADDVLACLNTLLDAEPFSETPASRRRTVNGCEELETVSTLNCIHRD